MRLISIKRDDLLCHSTPVVVCLLNQRARGGKLNLESFPAPTIAGGGRPRF